MTIGERIKAVRTSEELNMNQTDFGKRISVSQNYLSQLENGDKDVTEKILQLVCFQFHVNASWLRNGTGEMFDRSKTAVEAALKGAGASPLVIQMIKDYLELDGPKRKAFDDFVVSAVRTVGVNGFQMPGDPQEDVRPFRIAARDGVNEVPLSKLQREKVLELKEQLEIEDDAESVLSDGNPEDDESDPDA